MLVAGVVPPVTGFVWFHWRGLVIGGVCVLVVAVWFWVSYSIAKFFGNLVASLMG